MVYIVTPRSIPANTGRKFSFVLVAASLASLLTAAPAHAMRLHTFVASYGSDSNVCDFLQPCATFNHALSQTDVGGEVTAIDSDGFGPINITQSVTITSPAGVEANVPPVAGGTSVTINAPGASVTLRGLTINGENTGGIGIDFQDGSSLTVIDCVVQNFVYNSNTGGNTGTGIIIEPASGPVNFAITNTIASNNGVIGIAYTPSALSNGAVGVNGVIDQVAAAGNTVGINISQTVGYTGAVVIAISNSVVGNNAGNGIYIQNTSSGAVTVSIDNADISGNSTGIYAYATPKVLLGRSVITGNGTNGINNSTSPNTIYTYGDNRINQNGTNNGGNIQGAALNTAYSRQ
jgi:hypothetical protein